MILLLLKGCLMVIGATAASCICALIVAGTCYLICMMNKDMS